MELGFLWMWIVLTGMDHKKFPSILLLSKSELETHKSVLPIDLVRDLIYDLLFFATHRSIKHCPFLTKLTAPVIVLLRVSYREPFELGFRNGSDSRMSICD